MRFALTTDQDDLRHAALELVRERAPLATTRALTDAGDPQDPQVWRDMVDMGLAAVDLPEELGGTGLSTVELAVTMEVAGSELYPGPLMSTSGLAAGLLLGDDEPSGRMVRRLVSGSPMAAVVTASPQAWDAAAVTTSARLVDGTWRLSGAATGVLGADIAEVLVVAARTEGGDVAVFAVEQAAAQIVVEPSLDSSRSLCAVVLDSCSAMLLVRSAEDRLRRAGLRASTALAAESVGAARGALALTVGHATTRQQFGRPIGAFQAVRHRLADVLKQVELATSAVYLAACHVAADDVAAAVSAPLALHTASDALRDASAAAVQLHGGMGFTWESACHWFVSWSETNRCLLGTDATRLETMYDQAAALA
ncbi:acyl-CoA dehydrogenase family protein [Nocardioides zeae]|uniref:Acyl-CoA/acyl-ACP dehydrogenase n=1 Tax=Nocardioides zeae TaxID=1457234 RepID=A0A6P0HND5_9ACTN|nr:acyl-CoA dehydrogenase family protein [Nocardioides zeae]NEN79754.1 acyl-CoA/acyl-ACP dehydrogenase [Nocardioides zeae]